MAQGIKTKNLKKRGNVRVLRVACGRSWRVYARLAVAGFCVTGFCMVGAGGIGAHRAMAQTLHCDTPISFGTIMNCNAGGTVTLSPHNGGPQVTGCITAANGTSQPGRCRVDQQGLNEQIQIAVLDPTIDLVDGSNRMVVDDFNLQTAGNGSVITTSDMIVDLGVGARLNVGAAQPDGSYSGAITVTIITE